MKQKDYAALHSAKTARFTAKQQDSSSEEDLNDISGEHSLVEDEHDYLKMETDEDDDFLEEGEISEESEDEDLKTLVQKYTREGNIGKLKGLVQLNREKCKKLKHELELEQQKERDRELKEVLEELNKVTKKCNDLERSLASSRARTPTGSPKRSSKKRTAKKKSVVEARQEAPRGERRSKKQTLPSPED